MRLAVDMQIYEVRVCSGPIQARTGRFWLRHCCLPVLLTLELTEAEGVPSFLAFQSVASRYKTSGSSYIQDKILPLLSTFSPIVKTFKSSGYSKY